MVEPPPGMSRHLTRNHRSIAAIAVCALAALTACSSSKATQTPSTGPTEIQGAASVTDLSSTTGDTAAAVTTNTEPASSNTTSPSTTPPSTTSPGNGSFTRSLLDPGSYNCTDTGVWQPFAQFQLTLLVGEPAAGSSCKTDVLDLPIGYCSTAPCAHVPPVWRIDNQSGVPAESLMMVVAPISATDAEFVCVEDLVPQPKQVLAITTTINQACPRSGTSNSVDIPYVPPATSDIPYVPPPASVDIPAG